MHRQIQVEGVALKINGCGRKGGGVVGGVSSSHSNRKGFRGDQGNEIVGIDSMSFAGVGKKIR